jgi:hypothetical protein
MLRAYRLQQARKDLARELSQHGSIPHSAAGHPAFPVIIAEKNGHRFACDQSEHGMALAKVFEHRRPEAIQLLRNPVFGVPGSWPEKTAPGTAGIWPADCRF